MSNEFEENSYTRSDNEGFHSNNTRQTETSRPEYPQQQTQSYYTRPQPGGQRPPYPPPPNVPPYYPPPYPMYGMPPRKPKGSGGKIFLWCLCSAVVIIIAGVLIFTVSSGFTETQTEEKEPSGGSTVEFSYGESSDIIKAPDANANPDGPQISATETPEGQSENTQTAAKSMIKPRSQSYVSLPMIRTAIISVPPKAKARALLQQRTVTYLPIVMLLMTAKKQV